MSLLVHFLALNMLHGGVFHSCDVSHLLELEVIEIAPNRRLLLAKGHLHLACEDSALRCPKLRTGGKQ